MAWNKTKKKNSLTFIHFDTSVFVSFHVWMVKNSQDVYGNASLGWFFCVFFHRNPSLWCWKLWIMITHQKQVKRQLLNNKNEDLFQNIVLPEQRLAVTRRLCVMPDGRLSLNVPARWIWMVWSNNIREMLTCWGFYPPPSPGLIEKEKIAIEFCIPVPNNDSRIFMIFQQ